MHEDVSAEDEGMIVYLGDRGTTAGANVREDAMCFGVFAQGFEVEVVYRRALGFVDSGARAADMFDIGRVGLSVPYKFYELVQVKVLTRKTV